MDSQQGYKKRKFAEPKKREKAERLSRVDDSACLEHNSEENTAFIGCMKPTDNSFLVQRWRRTKKVVLCPTCKWEVVSSNNPRDNGITTIFGL